MFLRSSKYTKIGPYGLGVLLLITVAVTLRLILISNGWPLTNSDEGIWGLQALHILTLGERPIFMYGQNYMGTIEAYLGACFFWLFGPSLLALRLGVMLMYTGFLIALYLLARLLYSKGVALAALFYLCWGSSDTLFGQLMAQGGYVETPLFGILSLLLASWLVLSFHSDMNPQGLFPEGTRRKRHLAYGCLGGVIGLGIWIHLLVLPFVCTSLFLLLLFCHRELRTRAILFGVLGFVIGAFPLLLFNIQHFQDNSLLVLWHLYRAGGLQLPSGENLGTCILGAILITIPTATGANPLCPISEPNPWIHQLSLSCMGFQANWGVGVVILWALAISAVIKELLKQRQVLSTSGSPAEKEHLVRCTCRFMLLASVGLTALSYATSPNAALYPASTARYLVGLPVATPAIIAFLWPGRTLSKAALTRLVTVWTIGKIATIIALCIFCFVGAALILEMINTFRQISATILPVKAGFYLMEPLVVTSALVVYFWLKRSQAGSTLPHSIVKCYIKDIIKIFLFCFIVFILLCGTVSTFRSIPDTQKNMQRQNTLINSLLHHHAPHIYSDYWTCNRLIFLSDERIICSVLNTDLSLGQNRYQPYEQIVARDRHPAYVFEVDSGPGDFQDQAVVDGISLNWTFTQHFAASYHRFNLAGFAIYLPVSNGPT